MINSDQYQKLQFAMSLEQAHLALLLEADRLDIDVFGSDFDVSMGNLVFTLCMDNGLDLEDGNQYCLKATSEEICAYNLGRLRTALSENLLCMVPPLAQEFSLVLRDYLNAEEMAEVLARNATAQPGVCHSHDFCDANMAMEEAVKNLLLPCPGDHPDWTPEQDAAFDLWNAAWDLAKTNGFNPNL